MLQAPDLSVQPADQLQTELNCFVFLKGPIVDELRLGAAKMRQHSLVAVAGLDVAFSAASRANSGSTTLRACIAARGLVRSAMS